jgi:AraC-like DNA-binding protein
MTTFLFAGFFMSLFLIVLLAGKRSRVQSDYYLISLLAVYGLVIGGAFVELFNRNNDYPYPHLMNISWLFLMLHGPLLWFYIKSLTRPRFHIKPIHLLHFIPFIVLFIVHYFNFLQLPQSEKIVVVENELFRNTSFFKVSVASIGISTITYNIIGLFLLKSHKKNIENHYSHIEDIDLKWLRTLVIAALTVFSLNVLLFNLNIIIPFAGYYELSQIAYVFATLYVLYLGFFGIRQGRIFVSGHAMVDEQATTSPLLSHNRPGTLEIPATPDKQEYADIISRLTILMEQEQPWLDPELNIRKLGRLMQTRHEVISEVLNAGLNQNFFDYINRYRIEEFKLQCLNREKKHLSIMGIAHECGFNSKAAFYRAFNKFEATSPTAWISKVS